MEFEGEIVSLGNTDVKIKNLMRAVNAREGDIRALKSQIEEKDRLLAEAAERISRLIGKNISDGWHAARSRKKTRGRLRHKTTNELRPET